MLKKCLLLVGLLGGLVAPASLMAAPAYVQSNYSVPQSPLGSVFSTFAGAQSAGNFNVVVVGWSDTTSNITSVTDSLGNVYLLAVGPTVQAGIATQSIYYAMNVAAATSGANTVTVQFNAPANYVDLRIAEYSGVAISAALDVTAAAFGNGTTSDSGFATTSNANDLLIGANLVQSGTAGPGSGYTSRVITNPDSDILEDRVVTAVGSYNSSAPMTGSHAWIMQMAAFRATAAGGGDTQAPTAPGSLTATATSSTQIDLSWAAATDNIGVTNYLIERCQGAACTSFAQIATATGTTYSNTGLTASTSYSYRVRATDAAGNLGGYSPTASSTTSTAPDTQAPTAPTGLATTVVSSAQINLSWTASTDNVGVTNYLIERCQGSGCTTFTQIATSATTSYSNTGLAASTLYRYRVRATDAAGNLGAYSAIVNGTTSSGADTQAPTAPTGLATTVVSSTQIDLSWTASTDNVGVTNYLIERCQGSGCTSYTQIATSATTTYSNTGLTPSTLYRYRVRATDAAGNLGAYSSVVNGTTTATPDTQAPTAPTNVGATAVSSSQINVSWTASTDNVGVTGYLIERCQGAGCSNFVQVATATSTAYSNTGLTASTSYTYRVRARDAANNLSAYSSVVSATTSAAPAAPPAYVQGTYTVPQSPRTSASVTFTAAQTAGNLNVVAIGWSDSTSHVQSVSDSAGNAYVLAVGPTVYAQAGTGAIYYAANIVAATGNQVTVTFDAAVPYPDVRIAEYSGVDTVNPVDVVAFGSGTSASSVTAAVTTANANDLLVGANYVTSGTGAAGGGFTNRMITNPDGDILEDRVVTSAGSYSAAATLSPSGSWVMQMVAFRAAGSGGGGADTQPPTAPGGLGATAVSNAQINLSWTASTDNVGVTGYLIERCQGASCTNFAQIATATGTTYSDTGLTASTSYSYRVRATDAASNLSAYSATASATTSAVADTQAPTDPTGLAATTVSGTQINLGWTASTDNVGVTGYQIERCQGAGCSSFALIATVTTTTYSSTGLTAGTSYSYRVRATDAASNFSGYSNTASATTTPPDTQAPTTPGSLTATAVSSGQINLSWAASTDNVAVTSYRVERCQGATCTSFAQVGTTTGTNYGDTGLAASSTYWYQVRAADAAGNLSGYSSTANATTQSTPALPPLSYVQGNYAVPQTPQNVVDVMFATVQIVANLNVVAIGWDNTTSSVVSVTDTAGNAYTLAAGPTTNAGAGSHAIFYSAGIAGAAAGNRVRVTFSSPVPYPDVRIAEYAGVDPNNPVDSGAESSGSGVTSSSGSFVTTHAYDLIVGANFVSSHSTGPGNGFTSRMITSPNGSILEDRIVTTAGTYSATAAMASGAWVMQGVAFRGGTPPGPDLIPPVVTLTAPAANATLSGTATFTALVTDAGGSGIGGVQFQVDGIPVGPADTTAPYSITYDTAAFANGAHSVTAYAFDGARNIGTSAAVNVTFSNASPGNPASTGLWSGTTPWPLVAIHMNLLADGRLMMWDQFSTGTPDPRVYDPVTSQFTTIQTNDGENIFCAGHLSLPDGRLFVTGGEVWAGVGVANSHIGLTSSHFFDPVTNQWTSGASMSYGRWYPTPTTMADGRIFTIGGETNCFGCNATVPEIYDPATNSWTQVTQAARNIPWYPYTFVLPDGRLIVTGAVQSPAVTSVYDPTAKSWSTVDSRLLDGGSSIMYLPGKFLKSGTSTDTESGLVPSASTTYVLDMTGPSPAWQQTQSMAFPRTFHVTTSLPDGTVLVTGGGRTTGYADMPNAVYQAELWTPGTLTWRTLASMNAPRLYHQTATLLPDGRVLVAGSGRGFGRADPTDQLSGEVFSPPYLFKGPRPVITSAPTQLSPGQVFDLPTPNAATIASVSLVRIGSVTHTFNMDGRFVPLSFTAGSASLTVTSPATSSLVPPGTYMLFIVDTNGVPSVAKMVKF